MRVALLSPYSWTYPGGVTRHIEALAPSWRGRPRGAHSRAVRSRRQVLASTASRRPSAAPSDARRLRFARAHIRHPRQRRGLQHGAHAARRLRAAPASCARAATTSCTSTSRSCRFSAGTRCARRASCRCRHLPHLFGEPVHQRRDRRRARRAAADEPPAGANRGIRGRRLDRARFYGGRYRIVPNGVRVPGGAELAPSRRASAARKRAAGRRAAHPVHRPGRRAQGPARPAAAPSRRCATTCRRRSRSSAPRRRRSRT